MIFVNYNSTSNNPEQLVFLNYAMIGVFMDYYNGRTLSSSVVGLIKDLPASYQDYAENIIKYINSNFKIPFSKQPGKIPSNFASFIEFCKVHNLFLELLPKGRNGKQIDWGKLINELNKPYLDFNLSETYKEMNSILNKMENMPLNEFKQ